MSTGGWKRKSVFERLGPGHDGDITSPHIPTPTPPPPRFRHYSSSTDPKHGNLHNERNVSCGPNEAERMRDKRLSSEGGGSSRKLRHGDDPDIEVTRSLSVKRDKVSVFISQKESKEKERPYSGGAKRLHRSSSSHSSSCDDGYGDDSDDVDIKKKKKVSTAHVHPKRAKLSRAGNERKESEYQLEDRVKRKREKDSPSDGENHHQSKRTRIEYPSSHKDKLKRHLLKSESEADDKSEINWFSLAKFPTCKLPYEPISIQRHASGPVLYDVGVSSHLAGAHLTQQVNKTVSEYLKATYDDTTTISHIVDEPFGGNNLGCVNLSHLKETVKDMQFFNVGMCRRALTAGTDFMIRKKMMDSTNIKGDICSSSGDPPGNCYTSDFYVDSLLMYTS